MAFCKYSKHMKELPDPIKDDKSQQNNQFSEGSIYVREDDQDWGSAGMNDVQQDSDIN